MSILRTPSCLQKRAVHVVAAGNVDFRVIHLVHTRKFSDFLLKENLL